MRIVPEPLTHDQAALSDGSCVDRPGPDAARGAAESGTARAAAPSIVKRLHFALSVVYSYLYIVSSAKVYEPANGFCSICICIFPVPREDTQYAFRKRKGHPEWVLMCLKDLPYPCVYLP